MRLIDADRLLRDPYFQENRYSCSHLIRMAVGEQRTVDAVSRGYHDQVRWERDIALQQLEEYGIALGEKAYVVKLPYEPTPLLKDYNPHNTDVYCPNCETNLSGCFGGEPLPIVTCYVCGEIINPYKVMTKDELAERRKER